MTESLLDQDRIKQFLIKDGSLDTLLARLKQSLTTGEELLKYIKKKAQLEDDHFSLLKKSANTSRLAFSKTSRSDSFIKQLDKVLEFDELLHPIGFSYVKALNTMFDEISSLLATISRSRKIIKDESRKKEKDCLDAISLSEKAKLKYYHLCEDLDKLKSVDPLKKLFSLKNKSVTQQEDDLSRKVELADADYKQKVTNAKKLKDELLLIHRPNNNKKLKNYILELDIALNVQLQKYSTWNENLIMNQGILISPIQQDKLSMKSVINSIDNEKDLYDYILKNSSTPTNKALIPIDYTVHPSLAKSNQANKPFLNNQNHTNVQQANQTRIGLNSKVGTGIPASKSNSGISPVSKVLNSGNSPYSNQSHIPTSYDNAVPNTSHISTPYDNVVSNNSHISTPYDNVVSNPTSQPYDKSITPFDKNQNSAYSTPAINSNKSNSNGLPILPDEPINYSSLDPERNNTSTLIDQPTFGVSIEDVIQFAGIDNVPLVVKRCIEIIETFGLDIEGIYRTSPNLATVQTLKKKIDEKFTNYLLVGNNIDPSNILDADINCIASLLKLYFAELPEPLLTQQYYQAFIDVIKEDVSVAKKLHHLVYNLPDGAYFTLRALIFHLNNVASNQDKNRMTPKSLSIIWGPALFNDISSSPQDLSYKSKVVEELMLIATEIFDTDT